MTILETLSQTFSQAFVSLGFEATFGEVVYSSRPDLGQFQVNGALAAAKSQGQNPRQLAEDIINTVQDPTRFQSLTVAGPGFINVTLTDAYLISQLAQLQYRPEQGSGKIIIDFGGPNVAKPLHVGHLRSSIIGDSLRRIFQFLGYEIVGDIHLGDWGTQMGMLIMEIKREKPDLPYFKPGYTGPYPETSPVSVTDLERLYPQASSRCKEDENARAAALEATKELQNGRIGYRALWEHFITISIQSIKKDMDWLGVHFDLWYGESHYQDRIPPLLEELKAAGFAKESQGALIIPFPQDSSGKELLPLLVAKSDGSSLYATTDLAAIAERVQDDKASTLLYVVDQRQSLHFQQVFAAARLTGLAPESITLKFLGFGTVNGPDGKPFKTRAGGVMKLGELIQLTTEAARQRMQEAGLGADYPETERAATVHQIAKAALKFADLSNNRLSDYSFDLERFTRFEGKTGPYLIYTTVRLKSIFQKMNREPLAASHITELGAFERPLALELTKLPVAIQTAASEYAPHVLAEQLFSLAQETNRFYQNCNITRESDPATQTSWLALSSLVIEQLTLGLSLLGIEVPERM